MAVRNRLIECPNCSKRLEDTKQENITCRYCGHIFEREEVAQEDEDYIRKKMIIDLRAEMEIYKSRKKLSIIFMIISFVFIIPLIFAAPVELMIYIFILMFLITGSALFVLVIINDKGYEESKSKASDLSMRRRL